MERFSDEKGITLLEVLAAIVIFSICLLLFNVYFVNSFSTVKRQDSQLVAMNIARQVAEQWKTGNGSLELGTDTLRSTYKDIHAHKNDWLDDKGMPVERQLSTVTLNGITYQPSITIEPFEENDQLYIIKVTIKKQNDDKVLATLHTAIANPQKGE
ncbi:MULTISPECIES: prepilin-type N-terminal cleavage/methylation domain-containing protein [Aneurinibacillus]|uniref:Prepilin-type N-terminal cleavage/methylation domain-containing protein n=1 Tax=Aneurinibacillus thermoaerophilus TaxID=143495 RepID=A0A1G7ZSW0_ANETH|nr:MULTISPECIES: type II secretion system protein [Aneurinibacillus]AMA72109.1 hypothetical protein ACH33_04090 [Aneurinibacillus sp. XH2]MED0676392.1 type II secretion system protein [Aneurinibacillus thermoaerophilus]MED0678904.1 type II secretion system protein [Aneurinibacillus thermoaerophilus]MED0736441.1 type II secretion system protein [Aneurinibacillus thermoaerophilus]MED0755944.1 type II secretion system protein [Aneurinibacillus thermoaerophilus]